MIPLLVAAFVLSGAAGLIYESIWTRYLGLFVGHSAYAQIIVLVIFLGGMSFGAYLAGKWSTRIRSPLMWYAVIELLVGMLALWFDPVFTGATGFAYDRLFPASGGMMLTIMKWTLAGMLILPQSILLGATFPLMSAGVIRVARKEESPGGILGLLYFANSIGAAAGVLLAGFVLLKRLGLPGTLMAAAFTNIVVAVLVGLVARVHERIALAQDADALAMGSGLAPAAAAAAPAASPVRGPDLWRPLLTVAFGTAVASFIYEIAWIRMLSLALGSATHSFELMLSAFILGLALGAFWIRRRADTVIDPVRYLGNVQWVMGLLAVATLPLYIGSFEVIANLLNTVQTNAAGYKVFTAGRYAIALAIMLPATFCAGMTLPLITRVLMRAGAGERAIGAVYAVNTLGSIVGVVIAGLLLMPLVGLKALLILGALVDIALGVWLVARAGRDPMRLAMMITATGGAVAVVSLLARFDLTLLSSGVYRHGVMPNPDDYEITFYKDGRTASVTMRRTSDGFLTLSTNGKPDASMDAAWIDTVETGDLIQLTRDLGTQLLLPVIALAHAPRAENVAVIGHGSGMSSHILLGSQFAKQVVTIEIEPQMIAASRGFMPANRRVFDDPRSMFVIDDAKSYFASSGRKFDLILSEPSNPWVSGVSGLFTLEFYRRVEKQLAPNGVFGQWLHLYELSDGLALSVLAAIDAVFPAYEIFYTASSDVLIVASNDSLPAPAWNVVTYPGIAADVKRVVPMAAEQMEALRLGGRGVLRPMIMSRGAANSDFFPVLDLGAEYSRFLREDATGFMSLSEGRFDIVAALAGRRMGFARSTLPLTPDIPRSQARALSAIINASRALGPEMALRIAGTAESRAAVYRFDQLERMSTGSKPPPDWHRWIDHVGATDGEIHSGTAGVADTAFYSRLAAYAARAGAPLEARASVDFLRGIGTWNWPQVVSAGTILEASVDSIGWLPETLVRNGLVVAHLKLGNYSKAQESLRAFARRTTGDPFGERILASYLAYADTTLRRRMGWKD